MAGWGWRDGEEEWGCEREERIAVTGGIVVRAKGRGLTVFVGAVKV